MTERLQVLQTFLDGVGQALRSAASNEKASRCQERVFTALARPGSVSDGQPGRLPACAHLDEALRNARAAGPLYGEIATAFAAVEPHLTWTRRAQADHTASANFADGHANALIVGPNGYEQRDDVWVGVSLLAPHVRYPDHNHAPEEVYLVLSRGKFQHGDEDWSEPGIGGRFHNAPSIRHAMASGDTPLFAIWCLPVDKPN